MTNPISHARALAERLHAGQVDSVRQIITDLWQSWLDNRHYRGRREREEAFWHGYALGRRIAARQLAHATGLPDPAKQPPQLHQGAAS